MEKMQESMNKDLEELKSKHAETNNTITEIKNTLSSVQLLSRVWFFMTPWITAHQASLSITNSWSSLKLMSIESVMPPSHLILCHPLLLLPPIPPSIQGQLFTWGGQSIEVSALEGINSRISEVEEGISELEDKMVTIISKEQNKVKRMERT